MMITKDGFIAPHGGRLVDRKVPAEERHERLREAEELPKIPLEPRALSDLQMISTGVFSPLEGFMLREDYENVVEEMHLSNGLAWSMPVTLAVDEDTARTAKEGSEVALMNGGGEPVATMSLQERYRYDKEREASEVYQTTDEDHPGVAALYQQGDVLLGGEVELIQSPDRGLFPRHYYEPEELLALFAKKGWRRVVGFQPGTRSTGRTSTSRRAPLRPWTGSCSTPSSARPNQTTSPRTSGCALTKPSWSDTIPKNVPYWRCSRRRCAMRGPGRRSFTPSAARTTAAPTSS
jgi:PUA-like domain